MAALAPATAALVLIPRRMAREAGWLSTLRVLIVAGVALLLLGEAVLAFAPGPVLARLEWALLVETALALAAIDLRLLLIPDLYSALIAAAGCLGPLSPGLASALAGAMVGGGLMAATRALAGRWLGTEAMGWGDVKLAAALGALLGPLGLLWTVAIASTLGSVAGLLARRRRTPTRVPFGAFLAPVGVAVAWAGRLA